MNWLSILGIVVILMALVSIFGIGPRGGKPVAGTRLMSVARVFFVLVGLILLYMALKSR